MTSPLSELPDVPLIPPEVYASRDRGDLVLFCGAGVSKNAGRPLFGKLAKSAEDRFGPSAALTKSALDHEQFDQYFQLLEQGVDDGIGEGSVRRFVEQVFRRRPSTLAVHESIVKLAGDRDGNTRLVTTNYDRHFEQAAKRLGLKFRAEFAPRLAKPVKDRWKSIVHLHGGLDGGDLRDLVITSGDFGRAYITERWAARFASVLFENFDVLFLGYSADDVVMRYLLDAYAAQPRNERRNVWAIAPPPTKPDEHWQERWTRRRVGLITYDPKNHHKAFSDALADWAAVIQSADARRRRVAEILTAGPSGLSTANYHNQLTWLLSDPSGKLAEALLAPQERGTLRVTVEWLDEFDKLDLLEQRAERSGNVDQEAMAAKTPLVGLSNDKLALGDRARAFAKVLAALAVDGVTRAGGRSNSEDVLAWMQQSKRGAALHPHLADLIRRGLQQHGSTLPSELREAWTLVVDPGVNAALAPQMSWGEMSDLEHDLDASPSVAVVAQRLLHALTPLLRFQGSGAVTYRRGLQSVLEEHAAVDTRFQAVQVRRYHYAESIVVFRAQDQAARLITLIEKSTRRDELLREMAWGLNALLERALVLIDYTHGVPEHFEGLWYPAVGSTRDSYTHGAWALLPSLAALSGAALAAVGDRRARPLYEAWLAGSHLTQRRLALHAAASWGRFDSDESRDREQRAASLEGGEPPWLVRKEVAVEVLQVLRRLESENFQLTAPQRSRLDELTKSPPQHSRTTFTHERPPTAEQSPRLSVKSADVQDLANLLRGERQATLAYEAPDQTPEVLIQAVGAQSAHSALDLALDQHQPTPPKYFPGGRIVDPFPHRAARLLLALAEIERARGVATQVPTEALLSTWDKLAARFNSTLSQGELHESRDPRTQSTGKLAYALLAIAMPNPVRPDTPLASPLKARVEQVLAREDESAMEFLSVITEHLALLHFADRGWTKNKLLPNFDWSNVKRASAGWRGYLWSSEIDRDVHAELRTSFLGAFKHHSALPESQESLCNLLVFLALEFNDLLSATETRQAVREMSDDMRSTVVWLLDKRLEEAEAGAAELARSRVLPWLRDWPAERKLWSGDKLADRLTSLALRCGAAFGDAVNLLVERSLKLGKWPFALHRLIDKQQQLFTDHAHDISRLFDHVLPSREENLRLGGQVWSPGELQQLVDKLREAGESVTTSPEFKRLEARL